MKNFDLNLNKIIKCECSLGEGLFLNQKLAAWVDIDRNNIYLYKKNKFMKLKTKYKPSVIYEVKKDSIIFGSEVGIVILNIHNFQEKIISSFENAHDIKKYRSNDGCIFRENKFLSFMHRDEPENNKGLIYLIKNGHSNLIDKEIYIPNSFIQLDKNNILISDSYMSKVFIFRFDDSGKFISKGIWNENLKMTPDGGCLINDYIFITQWDKACIAVYNLDGEIIQEVPLPVIRPTNCKFDKTNNQLWVTSATNGLSIDKIKEYPQSGNTFIYDIY
jgi:sugar lactone lactonase YvrE